MNNISRMPMTAGQEVEQFEQHVPNTILRDSRNQFYGSWEFDGSGPREIQSIGVGKNVGVIAQKFNETMLQYDGDMPWEWRASDNGRGAGSHVHVRFDELESRDETVEGWTIGWNTIIDLAPIFAPFWFHNWESGGRDGTGAVSRWATPQTTRYNQGSMEQALADETQSRQYKSVTFNGARRYSGKPLTVELRLVDSHPAVALSGIKALRRVIKQSMDRGWSVKLSDEGISASEMYDVIYNLPDGDLISSMKNSGPVVFERGIPGVERKEFDSMYDVLMARLKAYLPLPGRFDRRIFELIRHGDASCGPQNNPRALWHVHEEEFEWDIGPEVK